MARHLDLIFLRVFLTRTRLVVRAYKVVYNYDNSASEQHISDVTNRHQRASFGQELVISL